MGKEQNEYSIMYNKRLIQIQMLELFNRSHDARVRVFINTLTYTRIRVSFIYKLLESIVYVNRCYIYTLLFRL